MPTFRAPCDQLRFKPPVIAGMNPYVLLGMVPLLRTSSEDHQPIDVDTPCETCGTMQVQDGRHRWIAAVIAGRADVLAWRT